MDRTASGSAYFAVFATDKPGTAALRERLRPQHRAWLRAPRGHAVVVRLGGPTLDAAGSMNGTLLVVQAADVQAVQRFLDEDPYWRSGLFERVEIRPWLWSLGQPQQEPQGEGALAPGTLSGPPPEAR
jgi:uncharacterized protein YciI